MDFSFEDLPDVVADRVRAATGEPQFLAVRRSGEWVIEALTGDRVTVMRVNVRDDGSVAENTETFLLGAIESVESATDAVVNARVGDRRVAIPVSEEFAALLASTKRREPSNRGSRRPGGPDPRPPSAN